MNCVSGQCHDYSLLERLFYTEMSL